jgi:hypothetical protein
MIQATEGVLTLRAAEQAVAEMNADLRQAFEKIRERLMKAAVNDIMARYDVGTLIQGVMSNESRYGANAADSLAAALGISKAVLYTHQQVAVSWKKQELQAVISRVDEETGYHLDWAHVWSLAALTSIDQRDELIERCFEDKLSSRDVRAFVMELTGARSNNPKGRPRSAPKSPSAGLAQLKKLTNSLVNAQDVFEEAVFIRLVEESKEFATEAIAEQLREAQEDQSRLEAAAKANRLKLQAALEAVERALYDDESEEGEEAAPASRTVGDEFLPGRKPQPVTSDSAKTKAALALAKLRAKKTTAVA